MKSRTAMIAVAAAIITTGCAHMTTTEQRMLSGAAIGGVGGAAVGAISGGSVGVGAAVGAAAGTVGGYLFDRGHNGR